MFVLRYGSGFVSMACSKFDQSNDEENQIATIDHAFSNQIDVMEPFYTILNQIPMNQ